MARVNWQSHIIIDPEIHHGDPCIRGTRIPVRTLVASLADGMTPEGILKAYPQLELEDVYSALEGLRGSAHLSTRDSRWGFAATTG